MKYLYVIAVSVFVLSGAAFAYADNTEGLQSGEAVVEHGGGCRKSSPPGQCCHMETRTGLVHCH